jgi:hypothetical protein
VHGLWILYLQRIIDFNFKNAHCHANIEPEDPLFPAKTKEAKRACTTRKSVQCLHVRTLRTADRTVWLGHSRVLSSPAAHRTGSGTCECCHRPLSTVIFFMIIGPSSTKTYQLKKWFCLKTLLFENLADRRPIFFSASNFTRQKLLS